MRKHPMTIHGMPFNRSQAGALLGLLLLLTPIGCASTPPADGESEAPAAASSAAGGDPAPAPIPIEPAEPPSPDCSTGLVHDDGQPETGYSFVPSAKWGTYVQRIHTVELPSREIDQVCVCWLRTRDDSDIDFEVVFFEDKEGRPVHQPYATVEASASDVPKGKENAGKLWTVDIEGVTVPEGMSYVGVRWDPSADSFFFICADHGDTDTVHQVYYQDDRSKGSWQDALVTKDPIFRGHKAIVVRTQAKPTAP